MAFFITKQAIRICHAFSICAASADRRGDSAAKWILPFWRSYLVRIHANLRAACFVLLLSGMLCACRTEYGHTQSEESIAEIALVEIDSLTHEYRSTEVLPQTELQFF